MPGAAGQCESGWAAYGGFCYHVGPVYTYDQAKPYCALSNATLVDIQSSREAEYVGALALENNPPYLMILIGYTDLKTEGTFLWDRTGAGGGFTNWLPNHPDNRGGSDCTEMAVRASDEYFMNDLHCSSDRRMIVCKKGKSMLSGAVAVLDKTRHRLLVFTFTKS